MFLLHFVSSTFSSLVPRSEQAGTAASETHPQIVWLLVLVGVLVTFTGGVRIYMSAVEKRAFSISDWLVTIALVSVESLELWGDRTNDSSFQH